MTDLDITRLCAAAMGITMLPDWTWCGYRHIDCKDMCQHKGRTGSDSCQPMSGECAASERLGFGPEAEHRIIRGERYNPLDNDAQAMALLKKFPMTIGRHFTGEWFVQIMDPHLLETGFNGIVASADLNRAICECVAKMQASK